jgi:hypothetical protein
MTRDGFKFHHVPTLGIELQGSFGGRAPPRFKSSMEIPSGDLTKAILPSRGGRLMVSPLFISFSHVA